MGMEDVRRKQLCHTAKLFLLEYLYETVHAILFEGENVKVKSNVFWKSYFMRTFIKKLSMIAIIIY